jgi:hypothetical protein
MERCLVGSKNRQPLLKLLSTGKAQAIRLLAVARFDDFNAKQNLWSENASGNDWEVQRMRLFA